MKKLYELRIFNEHSHATKGYLSKRYKTQKSLKQALKSYRKLFPLNKWNAIMYIGGKESLDREFKSFYDRAIEGV